MRGSSIGKAKWVPRKKGLTRKFPRHLYLQPLGARAPIGHLLPHSDRVGTSPKSEGLHCLRWSSGKWSDVNGLSVWPLCCVE